jgi:HAE1 family hydrophobic/amphiphilic exporter-1
MKALGFSINTLTLFGLTLATGLVVDDAIVVIENIARFIQEKRMSPLAGASAAMQEITGAVVATSLVLLAVFVPVAFFPGETGQLYKQFALTIACSITISLFNALTLTPTLSALLLGRTERPRNRFFTAFNGGVDRLRRWYHASLGGLFRFRVVIVLLFVGALVMTGVLFKSTPTGFTPDEDQGYFIVSLQAPEGSSIDYTERVANHVEDLIRSHSEVVRVFDVIGFGFSGNGPNKATMFVLLKDWADRPGFMQSIFPLLYGPHGMQAQFSQVPQAQIFAFNPPAISGVGNVGGFQFELEDRGNVGLEKLNGVAHQIIGAAYRNPKLANVYTSFRDDNPQLVVSVDRNKAESLNVPLENIYNTMQIYLGSLYVNDFDYLNRAYRVYIEADAPYRATLKDLQTIYVKSAATATTPAAIMPLSTLIQSTQSKSAPVITHYNLFRSIEISGQPAQGSGSGDAIAAMNGIAKPLESGSIGHEWSGISLDEITSGGQSVLIFALGIVVVFLVLAAQYESWTDPLVILVSVPVAILGALLAVILRDMAAAAFPPIGFVVSDVYAQVGYVMLIGLASKNAILIVEFANQLREQGLDAASAAKQAAETRLRPILMTSFAFILGILPLVIASGAGSASRHSLGTPVLGGMILSTFVNLVLVPVVYVIIVTLRESIRPRGTHGGPDDGHAIAATVGGETSPARV